MMPPLDPVHALAESDATGEVASIFADIRTTMQIPFLTSIWRSLAAKPENLLAVWQVVKPLYESGQVEASLAALQSQLAVPIPAPLVEGQLACVGISTADLLTLRSIVDVYNRSNGLNLLVLTALFVTPTDNTPMRPFPHQSVRWPSLPPVLSQAEMSAESWVLIQHINRFGLRSDEPGLATLWRHLAYWPGVLALIHAGFAPLHYAGTIEHMITRVLDSAQVEGRRLAPLRPTDVTWPLEAKAMINNYAFHPGLVARMVCLGGGLATWLRSHDG